MEARPAWPRCCPSVEWSWSRVETRPFGHFQRMQECWLLGEWRWPFATRCVGLHRARPVSVEVAGLPGCALVGIGETWRSEPSTRKSGGVAHPVIHMHRGCSSSHQPLTLCECRALTPSARVLAPGRLPMGENGEGWSPSLDKFKHKLCDVTLRWWEAPVGRHPSWRSTCTRPATPLVEHGRR